MHDSRTPDPDILAAHRNSSGHRREIDDSTCCACFRCLELFPPSAIRQWVAADERGVDAETAFCPHCGIDSVIGDASGYPITDPAFLRRMCDYWFGDSGL